MRMLGNMKMSLAGRAKHKAVLMNKLHLSSLPTQKEGRRLYGLDPLSSLYPLGQPQCTLTLTSEPLNTKQKGKQEEISRKQQKNMSHKNVNKLSVASSLGSVNEGGRKTEPSKKGMEVFLMTHQWTIHSGSLASPLTSCISAASMAYRVQIS